MTRINRIVIMRGDRICLAPPNHAARIGNDYLYQTAETVWGRIET
jgi:hypothetical protein